MNTNRLRRQPLKNVFFLFLILGMTPMSHASEPIEGVHYKTIDMKGSGLGYDVLQFFSFSCHHCYHFEQHVDSLAFVNRDSISIKKIPVSFGKKSWEGHSRLYLSLVHLGLAETYHEAIFKDIHEHRHRSFDLNAISQRLQFDNTLQQRVVSVFNSPAVDEHLRQVQIYVEQYQITGVPAMVVDDQYVTDAAMSRGTRQLLKVTQYLGALASNTEKPQMLGH